MHEAGGNFGPFCSVSTNAAESESSYGYICGWALEQCGGAASRQHERAKVERIRDKCIHRGGHSTIPGDGRQVKCDVDGCGYRRRQEHLALHVPGKVSNAEIRNKEVKRD